MAIITRDDIKKMAAISAIAVTEDELDDLVTTIEGVLAYAQSLEKVTTAYEDAEGAPLIRTVNVTRDDVVEPYDAKKLVAEAPEHDENFFVVPVIVKQSTSAGDHE